MIQAASVGLSWKTDSALFFLKINTSFFLKNSSSMTLLDALRTKDTVTANGAVAHSSTLNSCLDYFAVAGNRHSSLQQFLAAFAEDPTAALRILFWSRDCRGGAGSRFSFVEIIKYLQENNPSAFSQIFKFIPIYGYWKDIFKNLSPSKELVSYICDTLIDEQDHSLLAKYIPRKGLWFAELRKHMKLSPSEFRHYIVNKTQVVENYMCARKWSDIDYSTVPSVANKMYSNAFRKHDGERYASYISAVNRGEAKINSSVLFPCDLYHAYSTHQIQDDAIIAMWDNLPNFMEGCTDRILPICDVSGSMWSNFGSIFPIDVSVSLGCYLSERNEGIFKDAFMTFSEEPILQYLHGNIIERFRSLRRANWGMNTNLQRVFDLVLEKAIQNNVPEEDMPTKLLIISDMQFDVASRTQTNFEVIQQKYNNAGYEMPDIIFWNVSNDYYNNVPMNVYDKHTSIVSGYSPSILKAVLSGRMITPISIMLETINSDRYSQIVYQS